MACIIKSPNADEDAEADEDEEDFELNEDEEFLHTISGESETTSLVYVKPRV